MVALLTDMSVLAHLKASEAEVDHIFDHPLEAVLNPSLASKEPLVAVGSEDWPYDVEFHVSMYNSSVQDGTSQCVLRTRRIHLYHGLAVSSIVCIVSAA